MPEEAHRAGKCKAKETSEELMIEAETTEKWLNAEPSPKWQSAKERKKKKKDIGLPNRVSSISSILTQHPVKCGSLAKISLISL